MWSPKGQQTMIRTPGKPAKHYGIGAVNYHTGENLVIFRKHKKRIQIAEFLRMLLAKNPGKRVTVVWDNVYPHKDGEIEQVELEFPNRLNLLYLPTYSPWLNPIEMLWRHYRREVTHCELFQTPKRLIEASERFFESYNRKPAKTLSIIGAYAA